MSTATEADRTNGQDRSSRVARTIGNARAQVVENPVAAVIGAAAVSAGLALLLPASRRETELMGEVADRIGDVAREAADGAVEVGKAQVESLAQSALAGLGGAVLEQVVSNANSGTNPSNEPQPRSET